MYQKVADWLTPLNNAPIAPEEQAELKANFESIRETLNTSPSGFLHQITMRSGLDDSPSSGRSSTRSGGAAPASPSCPSTTWT